MGIYARKAAAEVFVQLCGSTRKGKNGDEQSAKSEKQAEYHKAECEDCGSGGTAFGFGVKHTVQKAQTEIGKRIRQNGRKIHKGDEGDTV